MAAQWKTNHENISLPLSRSAACEFRSTTVYCTAKEVAASTQHLLPNYCSECGEVRCAVHQGRLSCAPRKLLTTIVVRVQSFYVSLLVSRVTVSHSSPQIASQELH